MSDSSNTQSATLSGGATRVSFGVPGADTPMAQPPATRVGNGGMRWTAGGELEQTGGVAKYVHSADGVTGGGIMATRQRVNGQETVLLEPGNPHSRVQLAFAVSEGLVRETAPGIFEDVRAADGTQRTVHTVQAEQQAQRAAQANAAAQAVAGVFDAEQDRAYVADVETIPAHAFNAAVPAVMQAMVLGQEPTSAIELLVRHGQMDAAAAAEKVANLTYYHEQAVARAAVGQGVREADLPAFWAACLEEPSAAMSAMQHLVYSRDPSRIQAMARAWVGKRG